MEENGDIAGAGAEAAEVVGCRLHRWWIVGSDNEEVRMEMLVVLCPCVGREF